jgi:phosphoenolpyruvate carboxykinase (ATP)
MTNGRVNPDQTLEKLGISGLGTVHYNLLEPALIEAALRRGEGRWARAARSSCRRASSPAARPRTSSSSARLRSRTRSGGTTTRRWRPTPSTRLHADMLEHMKGGEYFVQDLYGGADPSIASTCGWSANWPGTTCSSATCCAARARGAGQLRAGVHDHQLPQLQGRSGAHGCRSDTVIALNFDKKLILIGGTEYAGENKKSVFTLLNYLLPGKGVMPMHCSANHATGNPDDTRSSSACRAPARRRSRRCPTRTLIGDDEHGWSDRGTFNFEGGCYAKTINLRPRPSRRSTPRPELRHRDREHGLRSRDAGTRFRR